MGDVVDAPVTTRVGLGAEPLQQSLGLLGTSGDCLTPRTRCERLAPLLARLYSGPLDQLERGASALARDAREADRAVVCSSMSKPSAGQRQRCACLQQRERAHKSVLGLIAAAAPRLELGKLEPQLRAGGRDPQRLLDEGHCLLEGADASGVLGCPHQLWHRLGGGAGDAQVARDLGGTRDRARILAGEEHMRPALMEPPSAGLRDVLVDRIAKQRVPERDAVAGGHHQPRLQRHGGRLLRILQRKTAGSTASIGRAAIAAISTRRRPPSDSGPRVALTDPRRLGATS